MVRAGVRRRCRHTRTATTSTTTMAAKATAGIIAATLPAADAIVPDRQFFFVGFVGFVGFPVPARSGRCRLPVALVDRLRERVAGFDPAPTPASSPSPSEATSPERWMTSSVVPRYEATTWGSLTTSWA